MGLLQKKVIVPTKLNGFYNCSILNCKEVENEQGGYAQITFKVTDTRNYTYTIFPSESDGLVDENGNLRIAKWTDEFGKEHKGSQYNYVIVSLLNQLNIKEDAEDVDLGELCDYAINNNKTISLEFKYNVDSGKMNIAFKVQPKQESGVGAF